VICPIGSIETAARVMRVEQPRLGEQALPGEQALLGEECTPDGYRVALHFRLARRGTFIQPSVERRTSARVYSAVPIFVRAAGGRWPEEAMTQDLSRGGVRVETCQIYAVGDRVMAKIPWAEWARAGEIAGRGVRVEATEDASVPAPMAEPQVGKSAIYVSVAVAWAGC
jgi:hypothetical protein